METYGSNPLPTPAVPDAEEPEYFADAFPPDGFPLYRWDGVPSSVPREAWLTETTHRDGQQGGLPLTEAASLAIYDILCRFTARSGAVR